MAEIKDKKDIKLVEKLVEGHGSIVEQLRKTIVGQSKIIDELLIALFAKGHCIIVGVPGLAKTLLISTPLGQVIEQAPQRRHLEKISR